MSENVKISKATGIMGLATGLSRVAGLARDIVVAGLFGAGFATDAFFMAFTIPNLLRRFFAEGSLTASFVPTYSEILHLQGEEEADRIANICWTLLLLTMAAVTILGIVGSPLVVGGIASGFGAVEGKLALTNTLNMVMFPYIALVSMLALLTGILNVRGHFFLPSLSPLFLNLSMILCGWFLSSRLGIPIMSLAIGVLIGGVLQLLIQYPVLRRMGIRLRLDFNFKEAAVMKIARLMLPGIAGVAIYQINVVVTRLLASFLPEGSVSYLYYGQRLFEFPQGIFIVSLAQAVLPSMSRQASREDMEGLRSSLRFALSLILLVTLPAMIGLVLCAVPIYSLFFMSGAFGVEEVEKTAMALAAYAPGLLFVGISRVVVPTFYALKNTRTPVWIAFWTLLVNALLGILLMGPFAHLGLAMALTLSSVFNSIALIWALRFQIGPLGLAALLSSLFKLVPAAVLMALFVQGTLTLIEWDLEGHKFLKGMVLGSAVLGGGGIYALVCWLLRVPEATEAAALFRKKLFRRRE